jgi:hypothetical protein
MEFVQTGLATATMASKASTAAIVFALILVLTMERAKKEFVFVNILGLELPVQRKSVSPVAESMDIVSMAHVCAKMGMPAPHVKFLLACMTAMDVESVTMVFANATMILLVFLAARSDAPTVAQIMVDACSTTSVTVTWVGLEPPVTFSHAHEIAAILVCAEMVNVYVHPANQVLIVQLHCVPILAMAKVSVIWVSANVSLGSPVKIAAVTFARRSALDMGLANLAQLVIVRQALPARIVDNDYVCLIVLITGSVMMVSVFVLMVGMEPVVKRKLA